jgi:hypothetical protein
MSREVMHNPRATGLRPVAAAREVEGCPTPQPIKGSFLITRDREMRNDPFSGVRVESRAVRVTRTSSMGRRPMSRGSDLSFVDGGAR